MIDKKYHVKKGDTVLVNTGIWKNEEGKIIAVLKKKDRVVLQLSNLSAEKQEKIGKKTVRKTNKNQGGMIERSISMHVSNVTPKATAETKTE